MPAEVTGSSTGTKLKSLLPVVRKYIKIQNMFVATTVSYPKKNSVHELERKTAPLHPSFPKNDVSILMKCVACATVFFQYTSEMQHEKPLGSMGYL